MTPSPRFLNPSEAARRLGVSAKALRLYEQRGLLVPARTAAGWRSYGPAEMARAARLGADLVGVNNRDLKSFVVDLAVTERLSVLAPKDALLVTESGIFTHADVTRMEATGAKAMLVGESLMRHADVTAATKTLIG